MTSDLRNSEARLWDAMRRPQLTDILSLLGQALLGVTAYILMREWQTYPISHFSPPWLPLLDVTYAVGMFIIPLALGCYLKTKTAPAILSAALAAAIALAVWIAYVSGWLSSLPLGVPVVAVIAGFAKVILFLAWLSCALVATIAALAARTVVELILRIPLKSTAIKTAFLLGLVAAGTIVPALAAFSRSRLDLSLLNAVFRYDELKPFPAHIEIDLSVNGRRVSIARTIGCHLASAGKEEKQARSRGLPRDYRFPSLKSFGHVFSDGSGIFVITPDICNRMASAKPLSPEKTESTSLDGSYTPLIGWTDNAAKLDTFDLFIDKTAYTRSNARVKIHGINAIRLKQDVKVDEPDVFGPLGWEYKWARGAEYGAFYAASIPESRWSKHPTARASLSSIVQFAFAFDSANSKTPQGWSIYSDLHVDMRSIFIARNGEGVPNLPLNEFADRNTPIDGMVIPLRLEGEMWRLSPAETGTITFYRGLPTSMTTVELPQKIALGAQTAQRARYQMPNYIYDPNSRLLFALGSHHFQMAPEGSVFASR